MTPYLVYFRDMLNHCLQQQLLQYTVTQFLRPVNQHLLLLFTSVTDTSVQGRNRLSLKENNSFE